MEGLVFVKREYQRAIDEFNKNKDKNTNPVTHNALGFAHCQLHDYEQAAMHYKQALYHIDDRFDERDEMLLLNNLSVALIYCGEFEEAIGLLLQAFDVHSHPLPLLTLANLYLNYTYNMDCAERYFLKALSVCECFDAYLGLAHVYLNTNEYNDALRCCMEAKKLRSADLDMLLMCALIKRKTGWMSEAYKLLEHAKRAFPKRSSVYIALGDFYWEQMMFPQSEENYRKALDIDQQSLPAKEGLIDILFKTQQYAEAISLMNQVLDPNNASLHLRNSVLSTAGYGITLDKKYSLAALRSSPNKNLHNDTTMLQVSLTAENVLAYLDWNKGKAASALAHLMKINNIPDKLLSNGSLIGSSHLAEIGSKNPNLLMIFWILFVSVGSPQTGLVFLKYLYDAERKVLVRPNSATISFWYCVALAEAGSPWALLDYTKFLYHHVNKRDNFTFYLRSFAYNRMHKQSEKLDAKTSDHLSECLSEAKGKSSIFAVTYEEILFHIRQSNFKVAEELLPPKQSFDQWPVALQYQYARIQFKKKSMISAKQALQTTNILLQSSPANDLYILLRLKLLYYMSETSNFEGYYADYEPKTFESLWRKLKLGCKYYISTWNTAKAQETLKLLKNIYSTRIKEWKVVNGLVNDQDDIFPIEQFADSYHLLKARWHLIREEFRSAWKKIKKLKKNADSERTLPLTLQIASHTEGYKSALSKSQKYLDMMPTQEQGRIWKDIMLICLENNLKRQAAAIAGLVGASRFPRIDLLLPYMKIAFFMGSYDSLESYLSRVDVNALAYQARRRKDAKPLIAQVTLFKFSVVIHKIRTILEKNTEPDIVKRYNELKLNYEELMDLRSQIVPDYLAEIQGHEYRAKAMELIDSSVNISESIVKLNRNVHKYEMARNMQLIPAKSARTEYELITDKFPNFDIGLAFLAQHTIDIYQLTKKYHEQFLLQPISSSDASNATHSLLYHAFLNNDSNTVNQLTLSSSGDLTFQTFAKNLSKQLASGHRALAVVNKDIYQSVFTYLLNHFYSLSESNWKMLLHFYTQLQLMNSDAQDAQQIKHFIQNELSYNGQPRSSFFGMARLLYDDEIREEYSNIVLDLWDRYNSPFYQDYLFRIHLDRCRFAPIPSVLDHGPWFLQYSDPLQVISQFVNRQFEDIVPNSMRKEIYSDRLFISRKLRISELGNWKTWYWCVVHFTSQPISNEEASSTLFLLVYGMFMALISNYSIHNRGVHEVWHSITAVYGKDPETTTFDQAKFSPSTGLDFISFLDSFFSGIITSTALGAVAEPIHNPENTDSRVSVNRFPQLTISQAKCSVSFKAAGSLFPLLLEALDMVIQQYSVVNIGSGLKLKEILLIVSALCKMRIISLDDVCANIDHIATMTKSLLIAMSTPALFSRDEIDALLRTLSQLSNQGGSLFSNMQFLLDLAFISTSTEQLKEVFTNQVFVQELSETLRQDIINIKKGLSPNGVLASKELLNSLTTLLRKGFYSLDKIELGTFAESRKVRLHLLGSNKQELAVLTELTDSEASAERAGAFLLTRTKSLLQKPSSRLSQSLVRMAEMVFMVEYPHEISLTDALTIARSLRDNFPQKDITPWLYSKGSNTALLSWKYETSIKQKKAVNAALQTRITRQYMFDNAWYDRIEQIVKLIAQYSAVGWICGLWNRHPQYLLLDMDNIRTQENLRHTALGFILESSIIYHNSNVQSGSKHSFEHAISLLAPFRMTTKDIKSIIRMTSKTSNLFQETFERSLSYLTDSPMHTQQVINSVLCLMYRKSQIATLSSNVKPADKYWMYELDRNSAFGEEKRYVDLNLSPDESNNHNDDLIAQENPLANGDSLFFNLMKRRVKLQRIIEAESVQKLLQEEQQDLQQLSDTLVQEEDRPEENNETKQEETTREQPQLQFITISELNTKHNINVLDRLVLRLQKHVVVSSFDRSGMQHCQNVKQLASTLLTQSDQHSA